MDRPETAPQLSLRVVIDTDLRLLLTRLLATTVLALSTGFASAEIALSGDARMGIIGGDGVDTGFTSRARVKFTLSGDTDSGLSFGASFRAHQAGGASSGNNGDVFISGAFGKLSMGDVDGAAQSAVGQVSGVGLTGLGDLNEIVYIAAGDGVSDPTALYEYSAGGFTGYVSVTNPSAGDTANAIGAKYATDAFSVSVGFEDAPGVNHLILGGSVTAGAVTGKLVYGMGGGALDGFDQLAASVDYAADALTLTAFYATTDLFGIVNVDRYGVGASYDLGGGASVVGGYADVEGDSAFDLGMSFSF